MLSGKCRFVDQHWRLRAAKRVGFSRKAPVAWQDFFLHDPRLEELLCYTDVDWAWDKISRRSMSGGVVILGGGVLNCWAYTTPSETNSNDFGGFWNFFGRFEFEFSRRENFFLNDSNFWSVHVTMPWPVCAHAIPLRMLWLP